MDLSALHNFRVAACDLNGQMRGKRVPPGYAGKLEKGAVRMPFSALNVRPVGALISMAAHLSLKPATLMVCYVRPNVARCQFPGLRAKRPWCR